MDFNWEDEEHERLVLRLLGFNTEEEYYEWLVSHKRWADALIAAANVPKDREPETVNWGRDGF